MADNQGDQKPYPPIRDHRGFVPSRSFASTATMSDINTVIRTLFVDDLESSGSGYVDVASIGSTGNSVVQEIVIGIRREQAAYRVGVAKDAQTRGIDALVDPYTDVTYVDRLQLFDWLHDMRTRLSAATGVSAAYPDFTATAGAGDLDPSGISDGLEWVHADARTRVDACVQ